MGRVTGVKEGTGDKDDTVNQPDPRVSHGPLRPPTAEQTFSSGAHSMSSGVFQMLGHKTDLSQRKRSEVIPHVLQSHGNEIRNQ